MSGDFSAHEITPQESSSWLVRDPAKGYYWFRVTWIPGVLLLSGDIGELVLTHSQALKDLDYGIRWLAGSNCIYLLQKSSCKQEFNYQATIESLVRYAKETGEDTQWEQLYELAGCDSHVARDNVHEALQHMESEVFEHDIYEATQDAECLVYLYPEHAKFQIQALQFWAKAVSG